MGPASGSNIDRPSADVADLTSGASVNTLSRIAFSEIAKRLGARYDGTRDVLLLDMLGQEYVIGRDGVLIRGQKAPDAHAMVIIDYVRSHGRYLVLTPWRSLRDFSEAAAVDFRQAVEAPIAHSARDIIARADVLLPMFGAGISQSLIKSDLAFTVRAMPNVHLHVEVCCESQDFPAESWLLFSNNATDFLPPQSLQALAELFKERLLSLARIY